MTARQHTLGADQSLIDLVAAPIAVVEADGVTIRSANASFRRWRPGAEPGVTLVDLEPGFGGDRATRGVQQRRPHVVPGTLEVASGRPRVEFLRRPVELEGESVWLVEGMESIAARTRVLDHLPLGVFTVELDGFVGPERTAMCERWLGATGRIAAAEYLGRFDPEAGAWFEVAFEAVVESKLPANFTLAQLPTRLCRDNTFLDASYAPIFDRDGQLEAVLVVLTDVTAEVEAQRAELHDRDMLALIRRLLRDRAGVEQFIGEIDTMLGQLADNHANTPESMRLLHTIKSNCALFGANAMSAMCHDIEALLLCGGDVDAPIEALAQEWNAVAEPIRRLLRADERSVVELSDDELAQFVGVVECARPDQIRAVALSWRNPPVRNMLTLMGEHGQRIAHRLGKNIDVVVRDRGLRLPLSSWRTFWSALTHVVRNAVDHGIEEPDVRSACGKDESGTLVLETSVLDDAIVVRIEDDGRGIDWARVEQAWRANVGDDRAPTRQQLEEQLFRDGFSTRDAASPLSGRGVGLSAAAAACVDLGGSVSVDSEPGQRTAFEFRFADPDLVESARASVLAAREGNVVASFRRSTRLSTITRGQLPV